MTIHVIVPRETKSLIRSSQRTIYPTKIPEQHHQLKNFISTSDPNFIYYASEREIYALHISSRKRELLATLPWEPQCLDAGYGWICVGGSDNGRCAFICIGEDGFDNDRGGDRAFHQHAEVDALLPIDLDPESRLLAHSFLRQGQPSVHSSGHRRPEVQIHDVGGSIINSVTIHRIKGDQKGLEDETVTVLTNNDSTIRVFSLSQSCVLDTIKFPTAMNHASISPDGKLLVAVGDEPQVFFCRRFVLPIVQAEGEVTFAKYEWHLIAEPKLSLAYSHDACFSTAFSPSGHICAVASEAGVITVFDTSLIRDDMERDEAVIGVFKSSRPYIGGNKAGAVRSMSFAPAPWDLLAWAEDQGRVCVVDLRNAFHSRQTIELETNSPGLDRANLLDIEDRGSTSEQRQLEIEARFVQRHREALDAQNHLAAVSHAADYMELAAERRRIERGARELRPAALREEFMQLTDSERHMLDSIRINRLQEHNHSRPDAAQQSSLSLRSSSVGSSERQADNQTTSDPPTLSNIPQNTAQTSRGPSSIREYMRQRDSERTERNHASDRSYQPHRRSSVVISNGNVTSDSSSSSHPTSLAPIGTATPTLSASPSHLTSPSETTVSLFTSGDPWQTIVEAASPGTGTSIADAASRIRRDRENTVGRSWDRRIQQQQQPAARFERVRNPTANMARLRQLHGMTIGRAVTAEGLYDDNELEMLRRLQETRVRREEGVGTMGIGWSQDGRNLFVGTEEGILEYTVNIEERKTFPGLSLQ